MRTKKQFLENMIRKIIKEENELLKAQSQCKAAIFQIKKRIDPLLQRWVEEGFFTMAQSKVEAYNNGYQLKINRNENWGKIGDATNEEKNVFRIVDQTIYLQPGTFFDEYFQEKKGAYLEGAEYSTVENYKSVRYPIQQRQDIATACKRFVISNLKTLSQFD